MKLEFGHELEHPPNNASIGRLIRKTWEDLGKLGKTWEDLGRLIRKKNTPSTRSRGRGELEGTKTNTACLLSGDLLIFRSYGG